ncbi:MAG: SDR family oxidoreductase [Rhodospirillales bacterium]|nr:SDR family oxidoreductase [Rhodospirillales bacterium]
MEDFARKVVVVTGGASGIGEATVRAFLDAGARVAFTFRTSAAAAARIETAAKRASRTALAIRADLTREADTKRLFAAVVRRLGPPDIVVANAGDLLGRVPVAEADLAHWRATFDTNVMSVFLTCRAAIRAMDGRKGSLVLMSSMAAFDGGGFGAAAYAAAKAAVASFARSLAKEVGPGGIRVNAVAPGLIDTPLQTRRNNPKARATTAARVPLRREGSPEDVARTILFLASDASAYVNGETVRIDGGLSLT